MKVMAVEVTVEKSAVVYISVPDAWDAVTIARSLTEQVVADAVREADLTWMDAGPVRASYIRPSKISGVCPDYEFADEETA